MRKWAFSVRTVSWLCAVLIAASASVLSAGPAFAQGTITQTSPTTGTVDIAGSDTYSAPLTTSGSDGNGVTFSGTSVPTGLAVENEDEIVTTGTLAATTYTISGTDVDGSGDNGNWTFTLTVTAGTITQTSPTSGTVSIAGSTAFTAQVTPTTANGEAVTYAKGASPQSPDLSITGGGLISTVGGPLAAGSYTISGTTSNSEGDSGTWTFTLTVTAGAITQTSLTTGTVDVAGSTAFTAQVTPTTANGESVTYAKGASPQSPDLSITGGGLISTVGGPIAVGTYTISGTTSNSEGDSGTWTYTLTVTADTITQTSPTTASASSDSYEPGSITVAHNVGAVTFVTTTSSTGLSVNSSGLITITGSPVPGTYVISGTDSDAKGDTGTWTYTLTVSVAGGGGGGSTIVQTSPTSGSTTPSNSSSFAPPALTVEDSSGAVTFVTTTSSTGLRVSAAGVISVTGPLTAGTYTVSGTDSDTNGDTGTWTYTLTVNGVAAIVTSVTFEANGGTGAMPPEKEDQPSPLTINTFTRSHYTFVDWNTAANGSGTSYVNGATYSFTSPLTLYAQWKAGKVPFHTVTFAANGGSGTMAVERGNTATAISPVRFTRHGYRFRYWNTRADGTGSSYGANATYSFTSSITLYAQWKKIPPKPTKPSAPTFTVTFIANGGRGTMAAQRGRIPTALSAVAFTRTGYTFTHWNTKPNGAGDSYANGSHYPFTTNLTLYAQWHRNKVVLPPAIPASGTVGPFALKSSTLSSTLEAQVSALASEVKTDHDTSIALVGYGDELSKADELNETLWAANFTLGQDRAYAVEAYLKARLAALGISSVTITAVGSGSAISGTTSSSASGKYGIVTAALT